MEGKGKSPLGKGILDERFVILGPLGSGGNAEVKLAFDLESSKRVAIKVMKKLDEKTQ